MTAPRELARAHLETRKRLAKSTAAYGVGLWRDVDSANLTASWLRLVGQLLGKLRTAQLDAAATAEAFTATVLEAQGATPASGGVLVPSALAGIASDGRDLASLLLNPVIAAKIAIRKGATNSRAMATGQASLDMLLRTQVADAGRVADGIAVTVRPSTEYVRMLDPSRGTPCSRCIILAGRRYRSLDAFERHPDCHCVHVPVIEDEPDSIHTDPQAYFASLTEQQQNKIFTNAGAQAIRDGADMNQVVNARRGANGLSPAGARITAAERAALGNGRLRATTVYGQEVFITTEGTTRRGIAGKRLISRRGEVQVVEAEAVTRLSRAGPVQRTVKRASAKTPRLMPESIYQLAASREDAIRLLKRFGYII